MKALWRAERLRDTGVETFALPGWYAVKNEPTADGLTLSMCGPFESEVAAWKWCDEHNRPKSMNALEMAEDRQCADTVQALFAPEKP